MQVIIHFPKKNRSSETTVPEKNKKKNLWEISPFDDHVKLFATKKSIRHDLIHHIHDSGASINWGNPQVPSSNFSIFFHQINHLNSYWGILMTSWKPTFLAKWPMIKKQKKHSTFKVTSPLMFTVQPQKDHPYIYIYIHTYIAYIPHRHT